MADPQKARDWLPIEIAARADARAELERAIADWSSRWFSKRRLKVTNYTPVAGRNRPQKADSVWRRYRDAVVIQCAPAMAARLSGWGLDSRGDDLAVTEGDRKLIEGFERRLLDDLAAVLERALGHPKSIDTSSRVVDEPFDGLGGVLMTISDGQGFDVLTIGLPLDVILPFCRRYVKAPPRTRPALERRSKALRANRVLLEAALGQADIVLGDLRMLDPGDVLILNRKLDQAADITVSGSRHILAHAKLGDADGRVTLTLQAK